MDLQHSETMEIVNCRNILLVKTVTNALSIFSPVRSPEKNVSISTI